MGMLVIGLAIGVGIGWTFPQPAWVAKVWADAKKDITGA